VGLGAGLEDVLASGRPSAGAAFGGILSRPWLPRSVIHADKWPFDP
jgi:hypothetical protein